MKSEAETRPGEEVERKRALIQRVGDSEAFRRSARLRTMLQHIAECTLSGRAEELTETRIAERVFGRENYHPAEDNVVRVSARQLRTKLHEYFETEGRDSEWVVTIPKGSYVATFEKRRGTVVVAEEIERVSGPAMPWRRLGWAAAWLAVAAGLVWLWVQNRELRSALIAKPPAVPTLFDAFVRPGGPATEFIATDSTLVLVRGVMRTDVTLEDYANGDYWAKAAKRAPEAVRDGLLDALRSRQITSLADFRIAMEIEREYPGVNLRVHHARNRQARDFDNDDNFIVVGSYMSNPWAEMFERQLRFRIDKNNCFTNVSGREKYCSAAALLDRSETGYARVAVIRNGSRAGKVLLIAGLNMESTEAAGEFFLDPASLGRVLKALGASRLEEIPSYEIILKTYNVGGTGRSAEIAAAGRD
jgi:hypothetical protein